MATTRCLFLFYFICLIFFSLTLLVACCYHYTGMLVRGPLPRKGERPKPDEGDAQGISPPTLFLPKLPSYINLLWRILVVQSRGATLPGYVKCYYTTPGFGIISNAVRVP
ncbi:hypothetical protein F5X98DRAFT_333811 [Xylaria grammica]|nr:hypothetical protein F5X98DRAFT_333811 [Xylaria grammica]